MAATGREIREREFTATSARRVYRVEGAEDESAAYAWVSNPSNVPTTVSGLGITKVDGKEDPECENCDEWDVVVEWGESESSGGDTLPAGTKSYKFSYQAPSGHIKRSLITIGAYENDLIFPFDYAPNFNGAINVVDFNTPDMHIEGFDLQPPAEVFSIPYADVSAVITPTYQALVRDLCGKVNNSTFLGHAAGEIMLARVDGQYSKGLWNLDFGFAYVKNGVSIPVGDNITIPAKDGMDLLWTLDIPVKDDDAKAVVPTPAAAYIERVWERANLNDLALPA